MSQYEYHRHTFRCRDCLLEIETYAHSLPETCNCGGSFVRTGFQFGEKGHAPASMKATRVQADWSGDKKIEFEEDYIQKEIDKMWEGLNAYLAAHAEMDKYGEANG